MYPVPGSLKTAIHARLPEKFRRKVRTAWADANKSGEAVDCFLEGPGFDRAGNLYVVDIPFGRVFRISPDGAWEQAAEYDGWPNGLKIHKDGRIFLTDYKRGVMLLDPASGKVTPLLETRWCGGSIGSVSRRIGSTPVPGSFVPMSPPGDAGIRRSSSPNPRAVASCVRNSRLRVA
jgi:hypothetical protein